MPSASLDRVQADLDVIKAALPADFPYDRFTVVMNMSAACAGLLIALIGVPGWSHLARPALVVFAALIVIAAGWYWQHMHAARAMRPRRWAWTRQEAKASGVAIGAAVAYILMTRWSVTSRDDWSFAAWRDQIAGPMLFALGVASLALGVATAERRSWLGWGSSMTVVALVLPWLGSRSAANYVVGAGFLCGGLATALILYLQLRQAEAVNGRS